MSHAYPLASSAREAVTGASVAALTRREAEDLSEDATVASLETEWLTLDKDELDDLLDQADDGPGHGYLQHYEDASGNIVLAVTYWKITAIETLQPQPAPPPQPKPEPDHTDDLYFRHGRNKARRKSRPVDPNQIDLFPAETDGDT